MLNVGIDHVFASGAVVGRATTHEWGRPSLRTQRLLLAEKGIPKLRTGLTHRIIVWSMFLNLKFFV